jgi:phage terminase large subunit-like protein
MSRELLEDTIVDGRRLLDDPNLFIETCFADPDGVPLRQGRVHRDLQEFLGCQKHALIELPRDHGKSTQVCARVVWELARDPSLRVKIVCATDGLAAERGRFLRDAIRLNPAVKKLFPGLRPRQPWGGARFTIERPAEVIGPSVASFGLGGGSTGTRADLLICDDIVDVKSLASKAERERSKAYFRDNLMNLLEPGGRFWGLFTPWHRDDLNSELKKNESYALFRRAVGENNEPVWPEHWTTEALAARCEAIGPVSFARGYRLVPVAEEEVPIREEWVKFWTEPREPDLCVLAVDPAVTAGPKADRSALVVLQRSGNEIRSVDAVAMRATTPHLVDLIDELDRVWKPSVILFEANGPFRGIADLFVHQTHFGGKIKTVAHSTSKAARAAILSVPIRNGIFRLKGLDATTVDPGQRELFEELTTFPVGERDDLLDAAGMGVAYLLNRPEPRAW